ncbi:MAG TPA: T9SS type A sorting domain-containing protein [Cyclobacteriaceae bacterium]|nr:T9SS type A sorting domain-containing protein [Cyclobacteriaceae bacterium]
MKSHFIALLAAICPWFSYAQFESPSVPNAVGFELSMENSSITISIGEPMINTFTSTSTVITQGYLQPILDTPCSGTEFTYYPNPAKDHLIIEAVGCDDQISTVQIIDLWGRVINTVSPKEDNRIDLGDLSQGLYVFKVFLKGGVSGNFSVIKIPN